MGFNLAFTVLKNEILSYSMLPDFLLTIAFVRLPDFARLTFW